MCSNPFAMTIVTAYELENRLQDQPQCNATVRLLGRCGGNAARSSRTLPQL